MFDLRLPALSAVVFCLFAASAAAEQFDLVCDVYRDISQGEEGYSHLAVRFSIDTDRGLYLQSVGGRALGGPRGIEAVTESEVVLRQASAEGFFVYKVLDREQPSYVYFEVHDARTLVSESGRCSKRRFTDFPTAQAAPAPAAPALPGGDKGI